MVIETMIYPKGEIGNLGYDNYFMQEEHAFDEFLECANSNIITHYQESSNNNNVHAYWGDYYSSPENCIGGAHHEMKVELSPTAVVATTTSTATTGVGARKKRRRTKSGKNKEELENQRMTHITVERNRRKQMNEYLAVIRGLMPSSYAQRGDQASIVGGAINFVKELEQQLQTLEAQKRGKNKSVLSSPSPIPFSDFFSFPQYSIHPADANNDGSSSSSTKNKLPAMAEIEVTMVESHANVKIFSKNRQRQLLKLVASLQCLWITILHLNVTTVEEMVLYTLSVKLEDGCQLSTVDEIADAVNCLLFTIEEESLCSN